MPVRKLELKAIGWPQLCAVSRDLLQAEPSMPDSEWKAQIKDRLAKWGFQYPTPEQIAKAMDATSRAYEQRHGRRIPDEVKSPPLLRQIQEKPQGLNREEAREAYVDLVQKLRDLYPSLR